MNEHKPKYKFDHLESGISASELMARCFVKTLMVDREMYASLPKEYRDCFVPMTLEEQSKFKCDCEEEE